MIGVFLQDPEEVKSERLWYRRVRFRTFSIKFRFSPDGLTAQGLYACNITFNIKVVKVTIVKPGVTVVGLAIFGIIYGAAGPPFLIAVVCETLDNNQAQQRLFCKFCIWILLVQFGCSVFVGFVKPDDLP